MKRPAERASGSDRDRLLTEYDDRDQREIETETWRQLEWIRVEKRRKPWWAKFFFKSLFGKLPDDWMLTLEPMQPSPLLAKLVRRRDNAFKRDVKKREAAAREKRCLV